jgi:hypothetical protein
VRDAENGAQLTAAPHRARTSHSSHANGDPSRPVLPPARIATPSEPAKRPLRYEPRPCIRVRGLVRHPSQEAHPKVRGGREPRPASPLPLTTGDLARELTTRVVTGTNNSRGAKVAGTRRGENRSQTAAGPPRDTFGRSASRSARNSHLPARLQLRGWDSNPQPTD